MDTQKSRAGLARWRFKIRCDSRSFTIFKREDSVLAPYYVHFKRNKKRFLRSLEATLRPTAEARAKTLIRGILEARWNGQDGQAVTQPLRVAKRFATVGEIMEAYKSMAPTTGPKGGVTAATLYATMLALRTLLEGATGLEDVTAVCTSMLDGKLLRNWRKGWIESYLAKAGSDRGGQVEARNRAVRTGASKLNMARSAFNRWMLQAYQDAGMVLPDLTGFLKEPVFGHVRDDYRPAADDLINRTFEAVRKLDVSQPAERDKAIAFWLAICCGLRRSEMKRARRECFVQIGGRPWLKDSEYIAKGGERLQVPVVAGWDQLSAILPAQGPVLSNHDRAMRDLGAWMRDLGWRSAKKAHELRAWIISRIVQETGNWEAARQFARHKDVQVTQKKYGRYVGVQAVQVSLPGSEEVKQEVEEPKDGKGAQLDDTGRQEGAEQ